MSDLILTILFGGMGYWKFKNRKILLGIIWFCTFGAFGIGWIYDIVSACKAFTKPKIKISAAPQSSLAPTSTPVPLPVPQPMQETVATVPASAPCSVSQPVRQQVADDPVQVLKSDFVDPFPIKKTLGGGFRYEGKDKYLIVFKDEKEYFDGDIVAERGDLILAEGFRVNSEAVALISEDGVLALRKIECGVEAARILPSGIGIVVTDDDKLLIMSKEGTKSKNFPFWSVPEEQRAITDEGCASIDEDESGEDAYVLRFFCFDSQTAWRKKLKFSLPDDVVQNSIEPRVSISPACIAAKMPDGVVHRFALDGEKL